GARGALALSGGERILVPAPKAPARDTTGAGDCFCGALAARRASGAPIGAALEFAAAAAAICVARDGAADAMPTRTEIENRLAGPRPAQ
ncbi:MAG: PfkB family carbohydrate kinase, partial [Pikeienuella sp.]